MYDQFGLTLTVTQTCNLRCTYCYAGPSLPCTMDENVARVAIDRAITSISPAGTLNLGFFGGEPLLVAGIILRTIDYARAKCRNSGIDLTLSLTTNGTVVNGVAWDIMCMPELELAISFDGLPEVHDRHRVTSQGQGSSATVIATIRRLLEAGRRFKTVMVVRPDTLDSLPESIK